MDVKYPICCGVDVHKTFLVAVIIKDAQPKPQYIKKRFSTFNKDLLEFKKWLIANDCLFLCMESTGKYWVPVFNVLEDKINVTVANPKWVRAIQGEKDDNKDAKWIADLFRLGMVRGSYIPSKEIRILREFTRYKYKLTGLRSGEMNRYHNCLTVGNLAVDHVFSDIFGKGSQAIIDYILSTCDEEFDDDYCLSLLPNKGKRKSSNEEILNAVKNSNFTTAQKTRISIVKEHLDYITNSISKLDSEIDSLVEPYNMYIDLLCGIPGMDRKSAIITISEISCDMTHFDSQRRLCSWAGLTPTNNQSAGKKKSVKISRAGVYLKPCLVQVAHAAVKDKTNSYYAKKFERIAKRRGKKRAIIAIARMILIAIYHIIKTGVLWNPSDLQTEEMPTEVKVKLAKSDLQRAIKTLISNGISIEDITGYLQT